MRMANREWVLKNALINLEADVERVEQLLSVKASPSWDLLGTLRVNLEVVEKISTELGRDHEVLLARARRLLNDKVERPTV